MDLLSQRLQRGRLISHRQGVCQAAILKGSNSFYLKADFQKCWNANWDHSTHCVKVPGGQCLFPRRRSEYKFRWESGKEEERKK